MRSLPATLPGYERLNGGIPVVHAPGMEERASEVWRLLHMGTGALSALLEVEPPELEAMLVAGEDWDEAPREGERAYPKGLPYFTRSARPAALVLPATLSPVFRPRTQATYPLIFWHELAHAFLLQREVVRTPAWLGEFVPQAASAAVARRVGLPLDEHLGMIDREPGFTVRGLRGHADTGEQMVFQNLLLLLGADAVEEFGDGFLKRLVRALWEETDVVNEERAEELLADAFGPGGREWLASRPEF
ncbi:MAG: hypothetical protein M3426_01475 [Actinomycetota bacterium]|nr:hypothetical protein [Actinomycetota bacterium]